MVEGDENTSEVGMIGGVITDAVSGSAISGVTLSVRKGWSKVTGDVITTLETNENGLYGVELPLGNYTVLMEHNDYITDHINVAVTKRGNLNCHGALVPKGSTSVPSGDLRIVLTWDEYPYDLDSHLKGSTVEGDGEFHVYFSNLEYSYNGKTQVFLDLDDTSSYGPETTTIYKANQSGKYSFYVHDYSNRGNNDNTELATSRAKVQVFAGETLVASYSVPTSGVGTVWHVFDFDADEHKLIPVNEFLLRIE